MEAVAKPFTGFHGEIVHFLYPRVEKNYKNFKNIEVNDSNNSYSEGTLYITNFRIFFQEINKNKTMMETLMRNDFSIPNSQIFSIEGFELQNQIKITKQDFSIFIFQFKKFPNFQDWNSLVFIDKIEKIFAYHFCSAYKEANNLKEEEITNEWIENNNLIQNDLLRFTHDSKQWKIYNQYKDDKYNICQTYPYNFVIPIDLDEEKLKKISSFRSKNRLPVITWKSNENILILRSSQPNSGLTKTSKYDVEMIAKYCNGNNTNKIQFIDCRPWYSQSKRIHTSGSMQLPTLSKDMDLKMLSNTKIAKLVFRILTIFTQSPKVLESFVR
jgi:myotubularin-related protein 1/2